MFTIKECTDCEYACAECGDSGAAGCPLCARLGGVIESGDRIFVLNENGPKAVGILGLEKGKVLIKGVYGEIDEQYRDLMNRALLNVCTMFNPITLRVNKIEDYWRPFGFKDSNGGMEVLNTDVKFEVH